MAAIPSLRPYRTLWRLIASGTLAAACTLHQPQEQLPVAQVLFICEHGNVKSLMAASYFNQMAAKRGLPFRAISRGTAPDSMSAPPPIVAALASDGLDVRAFRPMPVTTADLSQASRVILIGTNLTTTNATSSKLERWGDVPAASVSYAAARASLKGHIEELLQRLSRQ